MRRKRILVADDSETSRRFLELVLAARRHEVLTASDGEQALGRALAERPDLVMMDVAMPGLSGLDVLRRLRAEEATRDIPVIMVSVRGEPVDRLEAFATGCSDYLTKPVDANELLAHVQRLVGA